MTKHPESIGCTPTRPYMYNLATKKGSVQMNIVIQQNRQKRKG